MGHFPVCAISTVGYFHISPTMCFRIYKQTSELRVLPTTELSIAFEMLKPDFSDSVSLKLPNEEIAIVLET